MRTLMDVWNDAYDEAISSGHTPVYAQSVANDSAIDYLSDLTEMAMNMYDSTDNMAECSECHGDCAGCSGRN